MGKEKNDFWDIASLIPARPSRRPRETAVRDTSAVLITEEPRARSAAYKREETPIPSQNASYIAGNAPICEETAVSFTYEPSHSLINRVTVRPWKSTYTYYEMFVRNARRLKDVEGTSAPEVEFFSYMPQYSQLSPEQTAYYLWWRTNFRRGELLPASYSYLLLYLYELINLDDEIPPAEGQALMLRLWLGYRDKYVKLDVLLREWLCDYSLIHKLPPPVLPQQDMGKMLTGATLKEFFAVGQSGEDAAANAIQLFASNYNYMKSKFYREDNAALFDRVQRGALTTALAWLGKGADDRPKLPGVAIGNRDAFVGAICSYRVKRHIEVEYISFSASHELRYIMTDVQKYAENALRAAIGVKARLSIFELPDELRRMLDLYFESAIPPKTRVKKPQPIPVYEQRYELPRTPVSLARAAEIEESSWQTTKRLIEAFEDEKTANGVKNTDISLQEDALPTSSQNVAAAPTKETQENEEIPTVSGVNDDIATALGALLPFVLLALRGDAAAQRSFARGMGKMIDAVADEVNGIAAEVLGDVILEDAGGYYVMIEDYRYLLEGGND